MVLTLKCRIARANKNWANTKWNRIFPRLTETLLRQLSFWLDRKKTRHESRYVRQVQHFHQAFNTCMTSLTSFLRPKSFYDGQYVFISISYCVCVSSTPVITRTYCPHLLAVIIFLYLFNWDAICFNRIGYLVSLNINSGTTAVDFQCDTIYVVITDRS